MNYQVKYQVATGSNWHYIGALKSRMDAWKLASSLHELFPRWTVRIDFLG